MKRRTFVGGLGSAAAWAVVARAQQRATPIVGFLNAGTPETRREAVAATYRGLAQTGYIEGRNLVVEYRWSEDHNDQFPVLAADLVRRQVAVIVTFDTPAALAAKAATQIIPIVFTVGADPIEIGLVSNLSRPGGNLTGVFNLNSVVAAKRLELLHQLVPAATSVAYLSNPTNPAFTEPESRELQRAASTLGLRLRVLHARDQSEIEAAFAMLVSERIGGLVVSNDALFLVHYDQVVALAARHAVPAIYARREGVAPGALMSYGSNVYDLYQLAGTYAGRILNGERPTDLPIQQATKVELVINTATARALGLTFPLPLLGRADEVIE